MSLSLTWGEAKAAPIPDGSYYADLKAVEPVPEREYQGKMLEPGLKWMFAVKSGPCAGRTVSRITGPVPNEKTACGTIVAGLLGRMPKPGDALDLGPCVGKTFLLTVQGGKVATVSPPPVQ